MGTELSPSNTPKHAPNRPLIRTYGLHWKRSRVHWGGNRKSPGHLKGYRQGDKHKTPIDFRNQVGIYALYQDYNLLYIGQAGKREQALFGRLRWHRNDDDRWTRFSWFGARYVRKGDHELSAKPNSLSFDLAGALNVVEATFLAIYRPLGNKQSGTFQGADRYLQYHDEQDVGPSQDVMIAEIYRRMTQGEAPFTK